MKKIKSVLSVLIVLSIILFMISSCSNSGTDEASVTSGSTSNDLSNTNESSIQEVSDISEANSDVESEVINMIDIFYTAFGDSISRGCMLENPTEDCYPNLVSQKIDALQFVGDVAYDNFSVDGQKSNQLLDLVKTKSAEISSSDVITISTGANNILSVFSQKSVEIISANGVPISDFSSLTQIFGSLASPNADAELYQKVVDAFAALDAYLTGDEFQTSIDAAADRLAVDLPEIINYIKSQNPDTTIVVSTIYNPYNGFKVALGSTTLFDASPVVEKAVKALNDVITANSETLGYIVAEVYTAFDEYSGDEQILNANFSILKLTNASLDVHPTVEGQKLIADTVYETLSDKISNNA